MLPLNQIIELDSAFISEAWQQGLSPDQDRFREDNVAISKDKAFLIRRHDYNRTIYRINPLETYAAQQ
jgi:hypothetical protein